MRAACTCSEGACCCISPIDESDCCVASWFCSLVSRSPFSLLKYPLPGTDRHLMMSLLFLASFHVLSPTNQPHHQRNIFWLAGRFRVRKSRTNGQTALPLSGTTAASFLIYLHEGPPALADSSGRAVECRGCTKGLLYFVLLCSALVLLFLL